MLVDAGLAAREMAERLLSSGVDPASVAAVLVSHEHGDHARGAVAFSRRWGVRLMGSRGTYAALSLDEAEIAGYDVLEPGQPREVGAITVRPLPVPHAQAQDEHLTLALRSATDAGLLHAGDLVTVVSASPGPRAGSTDQVRVVRA